MIADGGVGLLQMLLGGIIIIYYYIYNVLRPNLSGRGIKDSGGQEVTEDPATLMGGIYNK